MDRRLKMSIVEAFTELNKNSDIWIRPRLISWYGRAITFDSSVLNLIQVPSLCGGVDWNPTIRELCSEWEIVNCGKVINEV